MGQREEKVREEREEREESACLDGTAHGSGEEKRDLWLPQSFGPGTDGNLFNFLLIWKLWENRQFLLQWRWTIIVQ
jgi:hypothetical protein